MPSPTSNTRPTSRTSMCDWYCWISDWRTEAISSALNFMHTPRHHLFAQLFKLRRNGSVKNPIADAQHNAADQLGMNLFFQNRLRAGSRLQRLQDGLLRGGIKRLRRTDQHSHPVAHAIVFLVKRQMNEPQHIQATVARYNFQEAEEHGRRPRAESLLQHGHFGVFFDEPRVEHRIQLGQSIEHVVDERIKLRQHLVSYSSLLRRGDQSLRVNGRSPPQTRVVGRQLGELPRGGKGSFHWLRRRWNRSSLCGLTASKDAG